MLLQHSRMPFPLKPWQGHGRGEAWLCSCLESQSNPGWEGPWKIPTFCGTGSLDEISKLSLQSHLKTSSGGSNDFCIHHFSVLPCILAQVLSFAVSPKAALGLLPSFWWSEASWGKSCRLIPVLVGNILAVHFLLLITTFVLIVKVRNSGKSGSS